MKRLRLLAALAATLLVVAALFVIVSSHRPASEVDPSTPRRQNSFTLVRVQQTDGPVAPTRNVFVALLQQFFRLRPLDAATSYPMQGAGLRVDASLPPSYLAGVSPPASSVFAAMAAASTGDTFPLSVTEDNAGGMEPFVVIQTPVGYPDTYRWLDVSLTNKKTGDTARWRLRRLPRLRHALPQAVHTDKQSVSDVALEARAWTDRRGRAGRSTAPLPLGETAPLFAEVRGVNHNPPGVEPWRVEIKKVEAEWQAPQPGLNKTYSTTNSSGGSSFSSGKRTLYAQTEVYPLPCAQAQRVARVHALLTRYQRHQETATFRDLPLRRVRGGLQFALPKPRTVTTPAGVRLVLSSDGLGNSHGPQNVVFRLRVEPTGADDKGVGLPASPLFRRYKKPVRVSAQADWDEVHIAGRFYSSDGDQSVGLRYVPASGRLDALSFTVTQEVTLETVPLVFTVPVARARPKADWGR